MPSHTLLKLKPVVLSGIIFVLISFLVFRFHLPKQELLIFYNIVIILSFQWLGFSRGLFFLGGAILLTMLIAISEDIQYAWNIPLYFITYLIVDEQLKKRSYYTNVTEARMEEIKGNINLLKDTYERHKKESENLKKREEKYNLLREVVSLLSSTFSLEKIGEFIVESALRIIGKSESIFLFLVDTKRHELSLFISRRSNGIHSVKAKKGDVLDEWVFRQRQCLLVEDIKKDFRFARTGDMPEEYQREFRSLISCPLIEERRLVGIIRMEHSRPYNYTSEDLRLLDIISDIGAASIRNAELYSETLELAIKDGLTGLYLRRYFLERAKEELMRCLNEDIDCSFCMIDIDNFKDYNDRFGHTAGDIVLKTLSKSIAKFFEAGIVCRYGGEEFAVCLPGVSKKDAKLIAEDLRKTIEKEPIDLRRVKTVVTISIGLVTFPQDAKLLEDLIQISDECLYKAKRQGRNRVVVAGSSKG